jgi:hypothetical protein
MNTAISIFRRLNEEFLSNFPQFDDHGEIIEYLHTGYCDPSHERDDKDFATYTGSSFKLSSKIFFCDNTYAILDWFFMQAKMPFYQQDEARKAGIRLTQDEETLLKCLSLLGLGIDQCEGHFFDDQLMQGLHLIKKDDAIYTWVVFAVQLLVDTQRVLGRELDRCFSETQVLRKWMLATLQQTLLFDQTNNVNEYYKVRQLKEQ